MGPGGYSNIFIIYICRLGPFFGVQNLEFVFFFVYLFIHI